MPAISTQLQLSIHMTTIVNNVSVATWPQIVSLVMSESSLTAAINLSQYLLATRQWPNGHSPVSLIVLESSPTAAPSLFHNTCRLLFLGQMATAL